MKKMWEDNLKGLEGRKEIAQKHILHPTAIKITINKTDAIFAPQSLIHKIK